MYICIYIYIYICICGRLPRGRAGLGWAGQGDSTFAIGIERV